MNKFRKKPVVIEAIRWTGENASEVQAFLHNGHPHAADGWVKGMYVEIGTLEGLMVASKGDWIIKGVKGEFYPCKPDIFSATYEPAEAGQPSAEPAAWMSWDGDVIDDRTKSAAMRTVGMSSSIAAKYDEPLYLHPPTDSAALRDAIGLLTIARCPNDGCVDGAIPHGPTHDGDWELEQCQWCYERSAAIAQHGGQSDG